MGYAAAKCEKKLSTEVNYLWITQVLWKGLDSC